MFVCAPLCYPGSGAMIDSQTPTIAPFKCVYAVERLCVHLP